MKTRTVGALIALLASAIVNAQQVTVERSEWNYELRDDAGTPIRELVNNQLVPLKRTTLALCEEAARQELIRSKLETAPYRCLQTVRLTLTAACAPPPAEALLPGMLVGKLDDEGFTVNGVVLAEACLNDDTRWDIQHVRYEKQDFPNCWVRLSDKLADCTSPPDAVLSVPASAPDMGVTDEQSPWIAGVDYPYSEPCPAEAKGGCWVPSLVPTKPCPAGAEEYCNRPLPLP
jgi:hypothetical protein